jgi:4-diphosphocytidyl-2-C-methyl-D-erythritol kinase
MFQSGEILTIPAPAKVNLHLAVKNRRPDGFHNIESVFIALDFGDTLSFEPLSGINALEVTMGDENEILGLPVEENIVYKAVNLFREKTGCNRGLKIRVEKRIPLGGGMGGGSSDAASTLLALNKLAGCPLSGGVLLEMGASLGSDVPFFASGVAAAWVSGRGELIKSLEAPRCYFVLVNPGLKSGTFEAYQLLDSARSGKREPASEDGEAKVHEFSSIPPRNWAFFNDFLPILQERENSAYASVISELKEQDADFTGLSGAGSTCFGVFTEKEKAEKAAKTLAKSWPFVKVSVPVGRRFLPRTTRTEDKDG